MRREPGPARGYGVFPIAAHAGWAVFPHRRERAPVRVCFSAKWRLDRVPCMPSHTRSADTNVEYTPQACRMPLAASANQRVDEHGDGHEHERAAEGAREPVLGAIESPRDER